MNCGLCAKELEIIQEILSRYETIQSAVLFGSSVTGNFKTASDVDIALKGAITIKLIAKIKAEFEDSNLPFFVDIVDYAKADNALKNEIDTQGKILYLAEQNMNTNFFESLHKEQWKEVRLGEVAEIKYGKSHQTLKNGNFLAYGSGGIVRKVDSYIYDKESVLIPRKGSLNNIFYTNKPFWVVDTMFYTIINNDIIVPKFLFYCLKIIDFDNLNVGSAVPSLTIQVLDELRLCIPPLETQYKIAEILSSFDDKIDLLHRQNKTLESLALTLFRHTFIDNPKRNEWEEKPLSEIANFLNGLACQKIPPKNEIDRLPVLKIKELREGITESSDWATSEVDSKYIVQNGDIIFSWSASLMVKIWNGQKCILNQHLFKITSAIYPKWFYYFWCLYHLQEFISIASAQATTMGHIRRQDLDNAICLIPDNQTLCEMDKVISPLLLKINNNSQQIQNLQSMRDMLLSKILNEKMEV